MKLKAIYLLALIVMFTMAAGNTVLAQQNTLTSKEKRDGWKLLFDGKTSDGWIGAASDKFPTKEGGWIVKDGMITIQGAAGGESANVGDIVTTKEYGAFDLSFDFRMSAVPTAA